MNAWEDSRVVEAIKATGRKKTILSGLWTEVCLVLSALSALGQGYEVYVVADASGGITPAAHEHALQRMVNAGAVPVTWIQVLLELQATGLAARPTWTSWRSSRSTAAPTAGVVCAQSVGQASSTHATY
jgi:isochorismate hydrolase